MLVVHHPSACSSIYAYAHSVMPHDPLIHPPGSRRALANNEIQGWLGVTYVILLISIPCHLLETMPDKCRSPLLPFKELPMFAECPIFYSYQ